MSSPSVVIVGAGFGGIGAAIELQSHGFDDVTLLDRAAGPRRHLVLQQLPGRGLRRPQPPLLVLVRAAPGLVAALLAARPRSSTTCATSPTITGSTADRDRRRGHRVPLGRRSPRWTITRRRRPRPGRPMRVIVATGQLHRAGLPADRRGSSTFAGHSFHSAAWDHDYDLRGKRVGGRRDRRQRRPVRARDRRAGGRARSSSSAPATGSCRGATALPGPDPGGGPLDPRPAGLPAPVHVRLRRDR